MSILVANISKLSNGQSLFLIATVSNLQLDIILMYVYIDLVYVVQMLLNCHETFYDTTILK